NVLKVWDFESGEQLLTLPPVGKQITAVRWVPEKTQVAGASGDKLVRFWNVDTGGVAATKGQGQRRRRGGNGGGPPTLPRRPRPLGRAERLGLRRGAPEGGTRRPRRGAGQHPQHRKRPDRRGLPKDRPPAAVPNDEDRRSALTQQGRTVRPGFRKRRGSP